MSVSKGLLITVVFAFFVFSCSLRNMMVAETVSIIGDGIGAFERDDDLEMLEKAFPGAIKLLEAFLETSPDNPDALVLVARFYGIYTFLFLEEKLEVAFFKHRASGKMPTIRQKEEISRLKKKAGGYYRKGAAYALRALELNHGPSDDRLKRVSTRNDFFRALSGNDVPALFWYGFNTGAFVNLNRDSVKAVSKAHLAEMAMRRVIALEPGYDRGGAHLFLLSYYASRPPMLGGNPEAAMAHYRHLKTIAGDGYLLADLYYARYYLYQKQDRETYRAVLTKIIEYPDTPSEFRLYNRIAAVRAKRYLDAIDDMFEKRTR